MDSELEKLEKRVAQLEEKLTSIDKRLKKLEEPPFRIMPKHKLK